MSILGGENSNTLISSIQDTTENQDIDNTVANEIAKKQLKNIVEFVKNKRESESDSDSESGYINEEHRISIKKPTLEIILETASNIYRGIVYEQKLEKLKSRMELLGEEELEESESSVNINNTKNINNSRIYESNMEIRDLIHEIGSIALDTSPLGQEITIVTKSFTWKGARVKSSHLVSQVLHIDNTTIYTPPVLHNKYPLTKFQLVSWARSPFTGHHEASKLISRILDLAFYAQGKITPMNISALTSPFQLLLHIDTTTLITPHCVYFNPQTQNFSNYGMRVIYTRVGESGQGIVICGANHLSSFALMSHAPAELISVLSSSNYAVVTQYDQFNNYNYSKSPSNLIYIYTYSILVFNCINNHICTVSIIYYMS